AADALDRMTFGIIILHRDGKPVFVNRQSESVLAQGDGLLRLRAGLSASRPADAAVLRRLGADACGTGGGRGLLPGGALHVARPPPRPALSGLIAALPPRSFTPA